MHALKIVRAGMPISVVFIFYLIGVIDIKC